MKKVSEYPRLNLGCGYDYDPNYINVDFDDTIKSDMKIDIEKELPFEDSSVQIVKAVHVLEHINNFIPLMKEIHRVLCDNGVLYIRVPEFPCAASIADPTHVRHFVPESFFLWTDNRPAGTDQGKIGGLFEMGWIDSIEHDNGVLLDRGKTGNWMREVECELIKRAKNEKSDNS